MAPNSSKSASLQDPPSAGEKASLLPTKQSEAARPQHHSIILNVCSFILVTEFCERLAYYGLSGSLPIFFHRNLGLSTVLATELNSTFTSLSYLTPLLGAYVADSHLGRFQTIVVFCLLYIFGLALCVFAALPAVSSLPLFMLGLFGGVGFGAGGIKPNVVVLGADQFDVDIPAQRAEKDSFFNWFYWAINVGATFSYGVLTNLAVNGLPPYISTEYGFFASFAIPSAAFVLAAVVFYAGKSRYRRVPPKGSALSKFFSVLMQAGARSARGKLVLSGGMAFAPGIVLTTASYFIQDDVTHMAVALTGAGAVAYGTFVLVFSGAATDWLRLATRANGGSFSTQEVQDAAQVVRLAPYLGIIIIFWAVYGQMNSNFVVQGCQMDLRVQGSEGASGKPVLLSSAMLNVVDSAVILVFIPVFDRLLYPLLTKMGIYPSLLRKIGAGLVFAMLAMVAAGWTEQVRKSSPMIQGISSNCSAAGETLPMSTMSVWWQTPQYVLVGVAEILTSISAYDLFYSEVPESMRSVCQALNLLTTTLGFIVAGALNSIFSFWVTSDLNDGHLEYIYCMLALLVLLLLVAFVFVSQSFEYHVPPPGLDTVSGFSPALSRAARELRKKLQFQRNGRK
jgi:peptide/histidine transporter 3/4